MEKDQCVLCKGSDDFYRINNKVFCSLGCYYGNEDKIKKERSATKVSNSSSTNKVNKSKNELLKKKSKQKKRKK